MIGEILGPALTVSAACTTASIGKLGHANDGVATDQDKGRPVGDSDHG